MSERASESTQTRRPPRPSAPALLDVTTEPHLQGVFAPTIDEVDVIDLKVEGELPAEIDGDYIRNGPNPRFNPIGAYLYPLDGDGMLHRVQIREGRVRYTNRFVRTPAVIAEEAAGCALWPGIAGIGYAPGPELVGPELAGTFKDLPDINVVRHGGKLLALGESANPFRVTNDLDTVGRETFEGTLPVGITAHPKIDPVTGEMVVFCYSLEAPYLTWSVLGADGSTSRPPTLVDGVDRPTMIHDMALTPTFVVLVLGPFFFDLAAAMRGGSPMAWEPDQGTRIALIPRDGSAVTWLSTDAFWLWHTANAYESVSSAGTTEVVLDYVRWSVPGGFVPGATNSGSLARMRLEPSTGRVSHETLADQSMEFPRIDDRSVTQAHRVIGTSMSSGRQKLISGDGDTLAWYDTSTQHSTQWFAGDLAVGEQTFIPNPGDPDPSHGWWTTIATDRNDLTSRLLIIPAADPASGPLATIHLPQRVPAGLHGAWLPTEE
ncbi:MAG: 9-cis-epoxycarotenoid dioxygenase [Pseudonocardiales bacterium]|nr:9-cis-epoxycarotenoid dioxygenase [Pseudonocardiales bacterium]